ncbi:hypothetical protein CGRA01v4_11207 [Colletotrichum graminicola]|nr:hypothetical protein CGRA01v4_11207 [Colletotrichum graminicola]
MSVPLSVPGCLSACLPVCFCGGCSTEAGLHYIPCTTRIESTRLPIRTLALGTRTPGTILAVQKRRVACVCTCHSMPYDTDGRRGLPPLWRVSQTIHGRKKKKKPLTHAAAPSGNFQEMLMIE